MPCDGHDRRRQEKQERIVLDMLSMYAERDSPAVAMRHPCRV
jgi:hypothetical protein